MTKARIGELEAGWKERNQRLKSMGLPKESFEQYLDFVNGRAPKTKNKNTSTPQSSTSSGVIQRPVTATAVPGVKVSRCNEWITGAVSSKPNPVYTGTAIKGIGTMHKSNAVPIFTDEEANAIAHMRR